MADTLGVLGVFANADVNQPVINHWRADEMVSIRTAAEYVFGLFRIAVELPEQFSLAGLARLSGKAVEPAVTAAENHLRDAVEHRIRRRRPLPMQDVRPG